MSQKHYAQNGTFHITTNARDRIPWCTINGVPEMLIDNLVMTRNMHHAELFAFCILPDHMHIIMRPGEKGVSRFMQSFKSNAIKNIHEYFIKNSMIPTILPQLGRRVPVPSNDKGIDMLIRWHNGFFDERIQTDRQRSTAIAYVQGNAMKHRYVKEILDWPWTSHHFQELLDPMEIWLD